ncbi:pentatricopeptide repeat-containing protein [Prunus yedoensis var. nudiflora]|uniref:Pentatricopeptide repeat-containing protein n=1 Tax=Prunus yedoensis var. nudiflora TaxID=2094558 RepID=A0A314UMB7_PRUYE|nr:pentatricopeptide repeat-containing protein [Prunus yedoensis var. nudiflora]
MRLKPKPTRKFPIFSFPQLKLAKTRILFSFLSTFPHNLRTQVVDEILQSFIPLRPRSRAQITYSYLLSFTLQCSNPFPLALAILQRTLRSGCTPVPQTLLLLSSAWLNCRNESHSVSKILLEMQSIGYHRTVGHATTLYRLCVLLIS